MLGKHPLSRFSATWIVQAYGYCHCVLNGIRHQCHFTITVVYEFANSKNENSSQAILTPVMFITQTEHSPMAKVENGYFAMFGCA